MSDKPQPPKSDVFSRTTYTVQYEIDGVRYFEKRSLDVANGNFLAPLGIEKVNPDAGLLGKDFWVSVDPESEEGKKVLNSMIRNNKLKEVAEDWAFNDDETFAAAMESGYIDQARGAKSFLNEEGVPNTDKNNEEKEKAISEVEEAEASVEVLEEVEEEADLAMAEAIDEEDPAEELRSTASEWFGSLLKSTANLK